MKCPHCDGGSIPVEIGSSRRYRCADCDGTGEAKSELDANGWPLTDPESVRRKHAEVARLAVAAQKMRSLLPRPTIAQIASALGVSYWAARHYIYDETKAAHRLGR